MVADILYWLCGKVEPNNEISVNINGESERIIFIKTTLSLLVAHTRLDLDPCAIYYADF